MPWESSWLRYVRIAAAVALVAVLLWLPLPFVGPFQGIIDHRHNLVVPAAARAAILDFGEPPWWNPYTKGGIPGIGALEDGTFFPTFPLSLLLDVFTASMIEALLFGVAGAFGTAALARRLGASRRAAFVAAAAVLYSNTLPVYLAGGWEMHFGMALLPWGFWLALGAGPRALVGLGLLLALLFLRGGMYPLAYLVLGLGVQAVARCAAARTLRPLLRLGGAGLVALLLAGPKLVPALLHGALGTARDTVGYCFTPAGLLVGLVTWELPGSLFEGCGAVGPVAVVLAAVGVALAGRRLAPIAAAALFYAVYALGSHLLPPHWADGPLQMHACPDGPALHDLVVAIPGLAGLWNPSRALAALGPLVAVAGALGVDVLLRPLRPAARHGAAICVGLAVALPAYGTARSYLHRHIRPLRVPPPAPAHRPFRQVPACRVNDAFCPRLHQGAARSATFAFHPTPQGLRVAGDPDYRGEVWWEGRGTVRTLGWSPSRLEYAISGRGPGRLVVNQRFAPGWTAEGDVVEAPRPAGELLSVRARAPGRVVLSYRPPGLWLGLIAAALGLVACGWLWRRVPKKGIARKGARVSLGVARAPGRRTGAQSRPR